MQTDDKSHATNTSQKENLIIIFIVLVQESLIRHTAHNMVSWLNPKQWLLVQNPDLMKILWWSTISSQLSKGEWFSCKYTVVEIAWMIMEKIDLILDTHSTESCIHSVHSNYSAKSLKWECAMWIKVICFRAILFPIVCTHYRPHDSKGRKKHSRNQYEANGVI